MILNPAKCVTLHCTQSLSPPLAHHHHSTRLSHHHRCIPPETSTNYVYHQKSFFPHTIIDWNSLPNEIIEHITLDEFLCPLTLYDCA